MIGFKEAGLVKSLVSHDKDELYIMVSVQGEYAYLSNGEKHPSSKRRRKDRKYLQLMDEHDEALKRELIEGVTVRDRDITGFICSHRQ